MSRVLLASLLLTLFAGSLAGQLTITTPADLPDISERITHPGMTLAASGGTLPYFWTVRPLSNLPPGLILDGVSGVVSGTPTTPGNFSFEIRVSDAASGFDDRIFNLRVLSFPVGDEGQPFNRCAAKPTGPSWMIAILALLAIPALRRRRA